MFVDFDNDSDVDLFIGSTYVTGYGIPAIRYFENEAGVFTEQTGSANPFVNSSYIVQIPTFADLDDDGDLDALVGSRYGIIKCWLNSSGELVENTFQHFPLDPPSGRGSPINNDLGVSPNGAPVFADMDGDSDLDLLVGRGYNSNLAYIEYLENTGDFTYEQREGLNISPFGGVDVQNEAAPTFADIDGDGDLDAAIGGKYGHLFIYTKNEDGIFVDSGIPFQEGVNGFQIAPVFVNIDGDTDLDLFYGRNVSIGFARNNNGTFEAETSPLTVGSGNNISLTFIDMDTDGDFDALVGYYDNETEESIIEYYENQEGEFTLAATPAPFDDFSFQRSRAYPNLSSADLDNDGDIDLIISETYLQSYKYATRVRFFENNGNGEFSETSDPLIVDEETGFGFTSFADTDGDGDLDGFFGYGEDDDGNENGRIAFYENTNPPPVTEVVESILNVSGGEPIVVDPTLTIIDPDNDDIVRAIVTISNFVEGEEELGFTEEDGITGVFDDETGILTFTGRASINTYRDLLRSVTFNYTGSVPEGRRSGAGRLNLAQSITFQVRDTDFTLTTVSIVSLDIAPGTPGSELNIYNAMSPDKGDDDNPFFHIENIETVSPENKVTIYNRWGDVVFEVKNYNNSLADKRFEGVSDKGKDLPTGTYFYKIELASQTITGYLSLKR